MKKAFLVDYSIRARVILDVSDDMTQEEIDRMAHEQAQEEINHEPRQYICIDNLMEVFEDTECPYDKNYDE